MRNISLFAVLLLAFAPAAAAAQSQFGPISLVSGGAVHANFDQVSADGCEHTFGEILILQSYTKFYLDNGVYITGLRDNSCTQETDAFSGYSRGTLTLLPLLLAHSTVHVVADSYSGGAPVTFDYDLSFLGTGKITRDHGVYQGDADVTFDYKSQRAASTKGKLTIDGTPASITSATLMQETSGTITLPADPNAS
jgi:hypothetical protein